MTLEDEIEEAAHHTLTDQQIGGPLEILKVLIVSLLGSIEYILHQDHSPIEGLPILRFVHQLSHNKLHHSPLQRLKPVALATVFRGQQLPH